MAHLCLKMISPKKLVKEGQVNELNVSLNLDIIVRSLSGKNWQDRDKADKVSISFPATPKVRLKCFGGCNEDIRKIYHPGGVCEKLLV